MTTPVAARRFGFIALALAALALPAAAQQVRMEWDFDLLRYPNGRPMQNVYWVSLPLHPDIADVANTDSYLTNKCVGEPDGPALPDGRINSDDLICAWWTARANRATAGTFTLSRLNEPTCTPVTRLASVFLGAVRFTGTVFDIEPGAGLQVLVTVPVPATYSPRNHAVMTGGGEPTWAGHPIQWTPTCPAGAPSCCGATARRQFLLSVPYDVAYLHSDEIACGLEGVDWEDANGDGRPDTCWEDADGDGVYDAGERPTGIFDGRSLLSLSRFRNDAAFSGMTFRFVTTALGRVRFTGARFPVVPGESYLVELSASHRPTLWLPDLR